MNFGAREKRRAMRDEDGSIEMTEKAWALMPKKQKKRMLKNLGHSESFAETKSVQELVDRGGGWAARDIHRTVKKFKKKHPGVKVRW